MTSALRTFVLTMGNFHHKAENSRQKDEKRRNFLYCKIELHLQAD